MNVRVRLLAQGGGISMVEYEGKRYEVFTRDITNPITQNTREGFVTYVWINRAYLTKLWK